MHTDAIVVHEVNHVVNKDYARKSKLGDIPGKTDTNWSSKEYVTQEARARTVENEYLGIRESWDATVNMVIKDYVQAKTARIEVNPVYITKPVESLEPGGIYTNQSP